MQREKNSAHSSITTILPIIVVLLELAANGCGSKAATNATGNGPDDPSSPVVMAQPSPVDATCAKALAGPFDDTLPTPTKIRVEADDSSVRLQWDGPLGRNSDELNQAIEGYRVCWGTSMTELTHGALFTERVGQLFGVTNGVAQVAILQAVDQRGRVSRPSEAVAISGDPSRVNTLRNAMTGFFDDFNQAAGPIDELKWNVAFSQCNDPTVSFAHVGPYQHALATLGNASYLPGSVPGCDRDQLIARPRAVFDFTGREGRVTFDLDGADGDRSTWYLDVFPYSSQSDLIDITGHVTFEPGHGHPGRFLRVSQAGNLLRIHQLSPTGDPLHVTEVDLYWDLPEQRLYPGAVMRHWEIRVAKNHAAVYIDGALVLETREIALDFERAFVHWSQFAYNPVKIQKPWVQLHWDNFGFDGPRSPIVTHNYKTAFNRSDTINVGWPDKMGTWTATIPDSLAGATRARFMFSIQTHSYTWNANDHLEIAGKSIPIPEPKSPAGTWQDAVIGHDYPPYSAQIEIPLDVLSTGANVFTLKTENTTFVNPHIEIDFDSGTAPPYTPPSAYVTGPKVPTLAPIGPQSWINAVNTELLWNGDGKLDAEMYNATTKETNCDGSHEGCNAYLRTALKGTVQVDVVVELDRARFAFGRNLGITRVDLEVDGKVASTVATAENAAAPGIYDGPFSWNQAHKGGIRIPLDTTKLTNGAHTLFPVAYDSEGTKTRNWADPKRTDPLYITIGN